jgi:hypothetical protein
MVTSSTVMARPLKPEREEGHGDAVIILVSTRAPPTAPLPSTKIVARDADRDPASGRPFPWRRAGRSPAFNSARPSIAVAFGGAAGEARIGYS